MRCGASCKYNMNTTSICETFSSDDSWWKKGEGWCVVINKFCHLLCRACIATTQDEGWRWFASSICIQFPYWETGSSFCSRNYAATRPPLASLHRLPYLFSFNNYFRKITSHTTTYFSLLRDNEDCVRKTWFIYEIIVYFL